MFDQSQIEDLLNQAKPAVIESLKRELTQTITWDVKEQAGKIVKETVVAWITQNIIPEIVEQLVASKEGLISVASKIAPQVVDAMVKSMVEDVTKKLGQSWERKKIFDALFQ